MLIRSSSPAWMVSPLSCRSHGQAVGRSWSSRTMTARSPLASARDFASAVRSPILAVVGWRSSTSETRERLSCFSEEPGADEVGHEVVGRAGQDRLGGVVLRDLRALLEDQDPVAELDRLVDVVGDADDRLAQLALDGEQLVLQPLAGDRVDGTERLVHQDHRRVRGQSAGDADALLLSTGQLAGVAVAVLRRVEADQLEQLVDALLDPVLLPAEHLGNDRDVLRHGHVREQAAALDDVADVTTQLVGALAADVVVADVDASRRWARSAG